MSNYVPIGKLGKPHGLGGEIRFWPFNMGTDSLGPGVVLRCTLGEVTADLVIEDMRWRTRFALLTFEGFDHKDTVSEWTNAACGIARDDLPPIDDDEFYLVDMLGLPVFARMNEDEEDREVGTVTGFIETGANDVIRVTLNNGGNLLVPFVVGYSVVDVVLGEGFYLVALEHWAIVGTEI